MAIITIVALWCTAFTLFLVTGIAPTVVGLAILATFVALSYAVLVHSLAVVLGLIVSYFIKTAWVQGVYKTLEYVYLISRILLVIVWVIVFLILLQVFANYVWLIGN